VLLLSIRPLLLSLFTFLSLFSSFGEAYVVNVLDFYIDPV
jgi:hypothetical protein